MFRESRFVKLFTEVFIICSADRAPRTSIQNHIIKYVIHV